MQETTNKFPDMHIYYVLCMLSLDTQIYFRYSQGRSEEICRQNLFAEVLRLLKARQGRTVAAALKAVAGLGGLATAFTHVRLIPRTVCEFP